MNEVLEVAFYQFPYLNLHFPGMNTGEKILFVTRESPITLRLRFVMLSMGAIIAAGLGWTLIGLLKDFISLALWFRIPMFLLAGFSLLGGWWWVSEMYRKSVFIITTRRLTKIIYTTPFTWYQFSLGLDEIQDTGSYASSYFEALFGLGYFVARSGAGAMKNFKIVNIPFAADLHNYVNKLLYAFKHHPGRIDAFRPFVPHIKGDARKELLKDYPEYKTEF